MQGLEGIYSGEQKSSRAFLLLAAPYLCVTMFAKLVARVDWEFVQFAP